MSLPENVPTATVVLDKPRKIAFTLGAIRRLKEKTGKSIDEALDDQNLLESTGPCVWALLVGEDRQGLTVEDVEDMISPGMLGSIIEAIGSLAGASVESAEGKAPAAQAAQ